MFWTNEQTPPYTHPYHSGPMQTYTMHPHRGPLPFERHRPPHQNRHRPQKRSFIRSAFMDENGTLDINKTVNTVDQIIKTVNQVSPLVQQVSLYFLNRK